jgi:DNA polymerase-3 subunit gamma/tau
MLSTSAFNALLKTLEEPPAHVKFIFATTEIRQVPVTVLSRCQRFDLRRIEPEEMIALLRRIATAEGAEIADDALALITRAAEGSARDATSLLDQAIAHGGGTEGETTAETVRAMLGLADRGRVLDLFDMIVKGEAAGALSELARQYADGADPMAVLRDLAEVTHWISVIKITPEAVEDPTVGPDERARGQAMAAVLPIRVLSRMWQMLLKAIEEVGQAPNAMMAAEMAVIRLTHVADLPTPADLVKQLTETQPPPPPPAGSPAPTGGGSGAEARGSIAPRSGGNGGGGATALALAEETALARYAMFDDVVALIRANRDVKLLVEVETTLRLARYEPGRIEFTPTDDAPADLAQRLGSRLQGWTGVRWVVTLVPGAATPTIAETRDAEKLALEEEAKAHPLVQAVLAAFPKARITEIRTPEELAAEAEAEALPEVEEAGEDWDPFEDG